MFTSTFLHKNFNNILCLNFLKENIKQFECNYPPAEIRHIKPNE